MCIFANIMIWVILRQNGCLLLSRWAILVKHMDAMDSIIAGGMEVYCVDTPTILSSGHTWAASCTGRRIHCTERSASDSTTTPKSTWLFYQAGKE